ncbi:hypothetical protein IHN63_00065 [Deinococcus sp. 6YEL10]|uniref:hypothetical protein n=1 Tax=Deinococcus sp. 6YEL10 TaxID=2745870 RepID=UPI001E4C70CE|nr:hypothetical protein [Deinococcus sp. 6YEL10]MCD0159692.1 hypothetical protein [Deinococcus sp. 6YEL10]
MRSPDRALQLVKPLIPNDFYQTIERHQRRSVATHGRPEKQWCHFNALMGGTVEAIHTRIRLASTAGDTPTLLTVAALPTLALWRTTKGVYEFDETLLSELLDADLTRIPASLLGNLPEYCVYVPLNGMRVFSQKAHGVFMHLADFHAQHGEAARREFRIVVYGVDETLTTSVLELVSEDLHECFEATIANVSREWEQLGAGGRAIRDTSQEARDASLRDFSRCLSLALYLCSEEPDLNGVLLDPMAPVPGKKPSYQYRAPMESHIIEVGFRFGGAIRKWREQQARPPSDTSGLGLPRAPHVRRGHFHLYRTGKGRTIPKLKWLHPILVNVRLDQMDDFPVTVRPVLDDPAKGE